MQRKKTGKHICRGGLLLLATAAHAVASAGIVSVSARQTDAQTVTVDYELTTEAIVTADILRDGASIGTNVLAVCAGDIMKRLPTGSHSFTWDARAGWPGHDGETQTLTFELTAWDVDTPPDVIVSDLRDGSLRYYPGLAALPDGVTADRYKTTEIVFRRIPGTAAGEWTMGSPESEAGRASKTAGNWGDETQHRVRFTNDWYMGVYPVTHAQYLRVTGNCPAAFFTNALARAKRPLDGLSFDAVRGLTWPTGLFDGARADRAVSKFRTASGLYLDLPTEAQWEFACRAGTTTPYATGETLTGGRFADNGGYPSEDYPENLDGFVKGETAGYRNWTSGNGAPEVGSFAPNGFGLYDLQGGVFEYCLDWVDPNGWDTTGVHTNPVGAAGLDAAFGKAIVARGGAWTSPTAECRSAARRVQNCYQAGGVAQEFGFRLALQNVSPEVRKESKTATVAVTTENPVGVTSGTADGLDVRTVWTAVTDYMEILTAKLGALFILR